MNVLSLFDGMSCGRVALERCGFKIDNYFASEIDKYAITVAANNYLDTIHIGDVTKVRGVDLPKIDLLIGGSPCQGFSFAGKQLNFDDPRSKLFFEFVRLKEETNCKYFFLENVVMKKEFQDVISSYLGVQPIMLNSSVVSAQSRKRLYWTNIPGYTPPEDKGILLKDIIDFGEVDRDKSLCLTQRYAGFTGSQSYLRRRYFGKSMGQAVFEPGCIPKQKQIHKQDPYMEKQGIGSIRSLSVRECEALQTLPNGYTHGVSTLEAKRMLGNGWTVDAIVEFFKHIPVNDLDLF